jgi:hypothetical protein
MNDSTGGGRGRRGRARLRRPGLLPAVLAGIALLVAACGGGNSSGAAGTTAYQKALAYAQCMRAHGEPGYPDPTSNGGFIINGRKDHLNGALMNSANKACQHLLPPVKPLTAAQQRQLSTQALKFVACIRAHGIPDMPDPQVNAQGVRLQGPPGGEPGGPDAPQFQAAQRACRKFQPGAP